MAMVAVVTKDAIESAKVRAGRRLFIIIVLLLSTLSEKPGHRVGSPSNQPSAERPVLRTTNTRRTSGALKLARVARRTALTGSAGAPPASSKNGGRGRPRSQ